MLSFLYAKKRESRSWLRAGGNLWTHAVHCAAQGREEHRRDVACQRPVWPVPCTYRARHSFSDTGQSTSNCHSLRDCPSRCVLVLDPHLRPEDDAAFARG